MNIRIEFRPALEDRIASFRRLAETGIYEGLGRLGQEADGVLLQALQDEAPVGQDQGGRLRDSIRSRQSAHYSGGLSFEYLAIDYARYVIGGTRPHDIYPRAAKALRWSGGGSYYVERLFGLGVGEVGGGDVFAKHAFHPGTLPNPFHERAWERSRADVQDIMARTGRELAGDLV